MPQGFDVNAARQAGYSDDEILSHLTQTRNFDVNSAIQSGYSKAAIINHLSGAPGPRPDFAQNPPGMPTPSYARGASPIERQELQNPQSPNFAGDMPGASEGAGLAEGLGEWARSGPGQTIEGWHQ